MAVKIVVPELGESVLEATIGHWRKKEGDRVTTGEVIVDLETDKVDLEVGAEHEGVLAKIERKDGEDVRIGDVLGIIEEGRAAAGSGDGASAKELKPARPAVEAIPTRPQPSPEPQDSPSAAPAQPDNSGRARDAAAGSLTAGEFSTPSARRLARERGVNLTKIPVAAPGARVTPRDVENLAMPLAAAPSAPFVIPSVGPKTVPFEREERVRMSRRRMTIAQRLVEAQHTAALLTTFNEIDMGAVVELRKRQKDAFRERYGVGLGVVSFFVKASITALKQFPRLNAEILGDEIVLKHYYDIGVAVGAAEGLVVPVLHDADRMSFAEIELAIKGYAQKAQEGSLALADLRGGTFSISNGGVFGSLLSTPILNPPQVGILGLHKIEERPVALRGQIVLRPMMYVALSYDHRIVDGLEAVQFLVRIKELVEDPAMLLIES
jgi:2-oxoglutarate dehydrogenase E2 component (dihydrolipoamide succinyltransferase)